MSTDTAPTTLPKPDLSLLRDIGSHDFKKVGGAHLDHYSTAGKDLYYIGTLHGKDFENKSHEIIGQAMRKYPPQIAVIEGLETARGISPDLGFDPKKPSDMQRFMFRSEENIHTAEYLRHKKIPFIGGEPTTEEIFKKLVENGYSQKDGMALHLLRSVSIWNRSGNLNKQHFPEQANAFLNSKLFDFVPKENKLTVDEFKAWYDAHKAELGNKDVFQVTATDTNPNNVDPNYFQKMSAVMDRARDENLLKVISEALEKNDKVLVVYGNAHQYKSAPVFENMFAQKPATERLILEEVEQQKNPAAMAPAVAAAPAVQLEDVPLETPKPSFGAKVLKYGSIALLAAAAIPAFSIGLVSVPVMALVTSSALAFTGSKMIENADKQHAIDTLQHQPPVKTARTISIEASADHKRGKKWVDVAKQQEQQSSRSL